MNKIKRALHDEWRNQADYHYIPLWVAGILTIRYWKVMLIVDAIMLAIIVYLALIDSESEAAETSEPSSEL